MAEGERRAIQRPQVIAGQRIGAKRIILLIVGACAVCKEGPRERTAYLLKVSVRRILLADERP